jgi:hypothetical protein
LCGSNNPVGLRKYLNVNRIGITYDLTVYLQHFLIAIDNISGFAAVEADVRRGAQLPEQETK